MLLVSLTPSRTVLPPFKTKELLPHREDVKLEDLTLYKSHMAVAERYNGVSHVRVFKFKVRGVWGRNAGAAARTGTLLNNKNISCAPSSQSR